MSERIESTDTAKTIALTHFAGAKPREFEALIRHFGNVDRILHADSGSLMAVPGMTTDLANRISSASQSLDDARKYLAELDKREISTFSRFEDAYPQLLFELNNPPPLLFVRGELPNPNRKTAAVVGAERASNAGLQLTARLAELFIRSGVQVVSSLHGGIATAAHMGSRKSEGQSYAILESGFNHIYPEDHVNLAIDIAKSGGAITEYFPETQYSKNNYTEANRLTAGLANAVVVTEVYRDSQRTLDLLSCCSQIGKLVFLMVDPEPGALADEESLNQAVTYGAIPMVGWDKVTDIIDALV